MMNDKEFVRNRANKKARQLFLLVVDYISFCHEIQKNDNPTYSQQQAIEWKYNGKLEDYITYMFVDNYLKQYRSRFYNKEILKLRFKSQINEEYTKSNETQQREDRIDIYVYNLPLNPEVWGVQPEDLYFAFESKILGGKNHSISNYLTDTIKFVSRNYTKHRFYSESMLIYVRNDYDLFNFVGQTNTILQEEKYRTVQNLQQFILGNSTIPYCYHSRHSKDFAPYQEIEIFHLFLDYTNMVS
jgi:hypothetical protein